MSLGQNSHWVGLGVLSDPRCWCLRKSMFYLRSAWKWGVGQGCLLTHPGAKPGSYLFCLSREPTSGGGQTQGHQCPNVTLVCCCFRVLLKGIWLFNELIEMGKWKQEEYNLHYPHSVQKYCPLIWKYFKVLSLTDTSYSRCTKRKKTSKLVINKYPWTQVWRKLWSRLLASALK